MYIVDYTMYIVQWTCSIVQEIDHDTLSIRLLRIKVVEEPL